MSRSFGRSLWSKFLMIALGFLFPFATGYPFRAGCGGHVTLGYVEPGRDLA